MKRRCVGELLDGARTCSPQQQWPVAQIFNLRYRRVSLCCACRVEAFEQSNTPKSDRAWPITNRRYGRVKLCATARRLRRGARTCSPQDRARLERRAVFNTAGPAQSSCRFKSALHAKHLPDCSPPQPSRNKRGESPPEPERRRHGPVAQIFNLPYRRVALCRACRGEALGPGQALKSDCAWPTPSRRYSRVKLCATALRSRS